MNAPSTPKYQKTIEVENIHSNITPEILEISIDKLRIVLLENKDSLASSDQWQTPAAILVGIVLTLCTAEFRNFLGVPKETWAAVFILCGGLSLIWLVRSLIKRSKGKSVEDLIACMKRQA